MLDIIGEQLEIGDLVFVLRTKDDPLRIGLIVGWTKTRVKVNIMSIIDYGYAEVHHNVMYSYNRILKMNVGEYDKDYITYITSRLTPVVRPKPPNVKTNHLRPICINAKLNGSNITLVVVADVERVENTMQLGLIAYRVVKQYDPNAEFASISPYYDKMGVKRVRNGMITLTKSDNRYSNVELAKIAGKTYLLKEN